MPRAIRRVALGHREHCDGSEQGQQHDGGDPGHSSAHHDEDDRHPDEPGDERERIGSHQAALNAQRMPRAAAVTAA